MVGGSFLAVWCRALEGGFSPVLVVYIYIVNITQIQY